MSTGAADAAGASLSAGSALARSMAGASAGASPLTADASASVPQAVGVGLVIGMAEAEIFNRINDWSTGRDGELRDLRGNLAQTQSIVSAAFEQARSALVSIVVDFRTEAETMRQNSFAEASQSLARPELVVTEARKALPFAYSHLTLPKKRAE